ncbi:phage tail assembly protein [Sulfitobacter sp. 1A15106]|uniref:phage tail assembly protein n=1 Tax=Sulfitobacter sp. 1A15106 TaxID=3368590 RepID=UPI00374645EA
MEKTIKLSKPINEGKIKELTLAEPTFGQLKRCGIPFSKGEFDFAKAGPLLEAISGVQEPFLDQMCAKDSMKVIEAMAELIGGDEGNSAELPAS